MPNITIESFTQAMALSKVFKAQNSDLFFAELALVVDLIARTVAPEDIEKASVVLNNWRKADKTHFEAIAKTIFTSWVSLAAPAIAQPEVSAAAETALNGAAETLAADDTTEGANAMAQPQAELETALNGAAAPEATVDPRITIAAETSALNPTVGSLPADENAAKITKNKELLLGLYSFKNILEMSFSPEDRVWYHELHKALAQAMPEDMRTAFKQQLVAELSLKPFTVHSRLSMWLGVVQGSWYNTWYFYLDPCHQWPDVVMRLLGFPFAAIGSLVHAVLKTLQLLATLVFGLIAKVLSHVYLYLPLLANLLLLSPQLFSWGFEMNTVFNISLPALGFLSNFVGFVLPLQVSLTTILPWVLLASAFYVILVPVVLLALDKEFCVKFPALFLGIFSSVLNAMTHLVAGSFSTLKLFAQLIASIWSKKRNEPETVEKIATAFSAAMWDKEDSTAPKKTVAWSVKHPYDLEQWIRSLKVAQQHEEWNATSADPVAEKKTASPGNKS